MWKKQEFTDKVDLQPEGEDDRHIIEPECECRPRISKDAIGRTMIIHRSFDGVAGFEVVGREDRLRAAG